MPGYFDWSVWSWWTFLTVIVLMFSLVLFIAGVFTAYFGSGKSRGIGAGLLVLGLVIGIIYAWMAKNDLYFLEKAAIDLDVVIINGLMYILGAIIGALIAIGIFLGAIMKA